MTALPLPPGDGVPDAGEDGARVDTRELRRALARYATGVALVTAPGGHALVVNSFTSVSLEPPLVAFCPARGSLTWRRMRRAGRLAVNVLPASQGPEVRRRAAPGADRLAGLGVSLSAAGVPLVDDALAVLECRLVTEHAAGDHVIAVARVDAFRCREDGDPLVFFDSGFGTFDPG